MIKKLFNMLFIYNPITTDFNKIYDSLFKKLNKLYKAYYIFYNYNSIVLNKISC